MLDDSRFKGMFEDKDFHRDKNSMEYKSIKPVTGRGGTGDSSDDEERARSKDKSVAQGGLNSLFAGHSGKDSTKTVFQDKLNKPSGKKGGDKGREKFTSNALLLKKPPPASETPKTKLKQSKQIRKHEITRD